MPASCGIFRSLATEDSGDYDVVQHIYRLTERRKEVADKLLAELPADLLSAMKVKLGAYNALPLSDLLRYVHEKYPEYYLGGKT